MDKRIAGFVTIGLVLAAGWALAQQAAVNDRHIISQKNRRFSPKDVAIRPGDTVVFQNDDKTDHHIMAREGPVEFESRLLPRGASYEVTLDEPGTWKVGCRIHRRMSLEITVKEPADVKPD